MFYLLKDNLFSFFFIIQYLIIYYLEKISQSHPHHSPLQIRLKPNKRITNTSNVA